MPRGGTLTFATANVERGAGELRATPGARAGTYVALSVEDTGEGIPPEIRDRVFEPFFTTKEQGRGTGMGLATVYGIATNHGGGIEVRSERGAGARFTLYFPVHAGVAAADRPAAPPALERRCRVLVIDDDAVVRAGADRALAALGCEVALCDAGPAGVAHLAAGRAVDVAIVDLAMPGMDGLGTFHALRAVDPALPVIVTSGYGSDGRAQQVLDAGACGFLQKPWTIEQLASAVASAAEQRRR
jgi:CheY-like chemotaxis protein